MDEAEARADLAHAISVVCRLLPEGMEVRIFREAPGSIAMVESIHPDGEVTKHKFTRVIN